MKKKCIHATNNCIHSPGNNYKNMKVRNAFVSALMYFPIKNKLNKFIFYTESCFRSSILF